jgi:hypothetical protein
MENSQSKLVHIVIEFLMFLIILAAALKLFGGAEKIQNVKAKNELHRNSMIVVENTISGELPEDDGADVYLGENNSPVFKTITGDGDVVTKAAVYTDLLNLPEGIRRVTIDGTVYANGDENAPSIDGCTNIANLIKAGREKELYKNTLQTKGETFIRTYEADDDGNITGVTYKTKTM